MSLSSPLSTRIYTPTELDAHVYVDLCETLLIDSPQGVIYGALLAVYTDGRFEVVTEDDVEYTFNLSECKVFLQ